METRQYLDLAEQAGKEGAHVAAVMYYRTAAEATASREEAASILELVIDYAGKLKKPADQLAVYQWGQQVIAGKNFQGTALEALVQQSLERVLSEVNKNATA